MICRHLSFKNRGDAGNSKPAKRCGGVGPFGGPNHQFFSWSYGAPFFVAENE